MVIGTSIFIVIAFLVLKSLSSAIDRTSRAAEREYGESSNLHEHTKKVTRYAARETIGDGSEEKTDQVIQDTKDVAVGAAKLAGKGAWLGAKAAGYGLKTAHQLYFNTDEAVEKVKKDWDSIPDKVDKFKTSLEEKAQQNIEAQAKQEAAYQKGSSADSSEYIPVYEFAKYKNVSSGKVIEMIQDGIYKGRKFGSEWKIHFSELK
jgi:hypothetical protein